jgi:hypothetical protein
MILKLFNDVISHKIERFLSQNYCVPGLCPSYGILNARKHDVSESGSLSVLRGREGDTYCVGSLKKSYPLSLLFLRAPVE